MFQALRYYTNRFFVSISKPYVNYKVKINGRVIKDSRISSSTIIEHNEGLELAENVFIGHFNFLECSNGIRIHEGCQITNYISIISHSSHISIRLYGKNYKANQNHIGYIKGSVEIGKYSFVGPHSVIMPNTTIGKGCLIQAYSYCKGDYPDFSIIGGNPAKVIGNTHDLDNEYLKRNPELVKFYEEWTKK